MPQAFALPVMNESTTLRRRLLRWPLPALLSWALAWSVYLLMLRLASGPLPALLLAAALGLILALTQGNRWRRLIVAGGFPLSWLLTGHAAAVPPWVWLMPLALLMLAYPRHAWHDAPLFPTPRGALAELARLAPLRPDARVLDAGCGLGHGLRELRAAYPLARLEGIEWSALLARLAAWRCPWAEVRRGDMWAQSWSGVDLVYLFQRPESMARALAKAESELGADAWLASLDFELPGIQPLATVPLAAPHRLMIYRKPFAAAAKGSS